MRIESLKKGFMAHGADIYTATQKAQATLFGILERQAFMLSFVYTFKILGIIFLFAIPLVFMLKKPGMRYPLVK